MQLKDWADNYRPSLLFRVSKKIRKAILDGGAQVKQLIIDPPENASKKLVLHIVLEGLPSAFATIPKLTPRVLSSKNKRIHSMGIDVNALERQAIEPAALDINGKEVLLDLPLSITEKIWDFENWAIKVSNIDKHISSLQRKLSYVNEKHHRNILSLEIRLLQNKKHGIKKQIDLQASMILYELIAYYRPEHFYLEDLHSLTPRLKTGKLAKIITYMIKRWNPIIERIKNWCTSSGINVTISLKNPYRTSQIHFGCGGIIDRNMNNYHIAKCGRCHEIINTHHNAALNIAQIDV